MCLRTVFPPTRVARCRSPVREWAAAPPADIRRRPMSAFRTNSHVADGAKGVTIDRAVPAAEFPILLVPWVFSKSCAPFPSISRRDAS